MTADKRTKAINTLAKDVATADEYRPFAGVKSVAAKTAVVTDGHRALFWPSTLVDGVYDVVTGEPSDKRFPDVAQTLPSLVTRGTDTPPVVDRFVELPDVRSGYLALLEGNHWAISDRAEFSGLEVLVAFDAKYLAAFRKAFGATVWMFAQDALSPALFSLAQIESYETAYNATPVYAVCMPCRVKN